MTGFGNGTRMSYIVAADGGTAGSESVGGVPLIYGLSTRIVYAS